MFRVSGSGNTARTRRFVPSSLRVSCCVYLCVCASRGETGLASFANAADEEHLTMICAGLRSSFLLSHCLLGLSRTSNNTPPPPANVSYTTTTCPSCSIFFSQVYWSFFFLSPIRIFYFVSFAVYVFLFTSNIPFPGVGGDKRVVSIVRFFLLIFPQFSFLELTFYVFASSSSWCFGVCSWYRLEKPYNNRFGIVT